MFAHHNNKKVKKLLLRLFVRFPFLLFQWSGFRRVYRWLVLRCFMNAALAVWHFSSEVTASLLSWSGEGLGCFFCVCYGIATAVLGLYGSAQWKGAINSGLELESSHNDTSLPLFSYNRNIKNTLR